MSLVEHPSSGITWFGMKMAVTPTVKNTRLKTNTIKVKMNKRRGFPLLIPMIPKIEPTMMTISETMITIIRMFLVEEAYWIQASECINVNILTPSIAIPTIKVKKAPTVV
jgi:hypothetical protein